ncbi:MAG: hypothetical protein AB8W37_06250 [Arsenophonus endosymbiont of Dermacentor nuttalli]
MGTLERVLAVNPGLCDNADRHSRWALKFSYRKFHTFVKSFAGRSVGLDRIRIP